MTNKTLSFIEKTIAIHGDKYDYSKVEYVNNHTKVCIICPEHGEFWQTPGNHLSGKGCPKCGTLRTNKKNTKDSSIFINNAKKIHNDKYDYSKVEYHKNCIKVCIICPEHGEFWQTPANHLSGSGCPKCGLKERAYKRSSTTDDFIQRAKEIHGDKYDYSKVEYINGETKVCIICPEHGEFWQIPSSHLKKHGCPKCANNYQSNTKDFILKANLIHKYKYDYSKVEYKTVRTGIHIMCPTHGGFYQTPHDHLQGSGCPKCSGKNKTSEEWIIEANQIHNNKYDYSKTEYINATTKVCIICPEHGEFWQTPANHLQRQGCPKCGCIISKAEDEIVKLLEIHQPQQRNQSILDGKEIDIYIPSLKLGIEYNGLRWHSEEFGKDHRYHLDKLNKCNEQGIKLIQIFEDEWINHRKICESKLRQICGLNTNPKIFARKCEIREFEKNDKDEAYDFLDKNHIQGRTVCTVALGAYYEGKLVGVMTFKREKEGYWDLNRFATDINYQCVGIGGKLFKYFTSNYKFVEIKSFADRRWTTNPTDNLYTKLGFKFDSFVGPTYWYYNKNIDRYKRFHKFGFRKQSLHNQYGLPLEMTEREMTESLGYTRIWDCGLIKYKYKN